MKITQSHSIPIRFIATEKSSKIKTGFQRYERPIYDYPTKYSPCRAGCPAGHDIARALYLLSLERPDLAYQVFREESPFPEITGRVCYHPCENVCNRRGYDGAIAINALERTFSDLGRPRYPVKKPEIRYPETIGIVGAGPAGLTCAYHLAHLGYQVTVYDANPGPGGVLAYGIPPYRLPRDILNQSAENIEQLGVQFRFNTRIGEDLPFEELRRRHSAIFLGVGLTRPRKPDIPLPKHPDIIAGLTFLREVSTGTARPLGPRVAIIGGGDVAIDAARSARRLGAQQVLLCCLEKREEMPAHPEEIQSALAEGIQIIPEVAPHDLTLHPNGLLLVLSAVEEFTRDPKGISFSVNTEKLQAFTVNQVIYAIGQQADLSFLPPPLSSLNRIYVGELGETPLLGVFAGGDITGTYNVVNAIGTAKRAAIGIDLYLRGWNREEVINQIKIGHHGVLSMESYRLWREKQKSSPQRYEVTLGDINLGYFPSIPRTPLPELPPEQRIRSFEEVNRALSAPQAFQEARRCFNCGMCNMCGNCFLFCPDSAVVQRADWGFEIDLDHCKGCGVCVQECPRDAMEMVPEMEARDADSHYKTNP